MILTADIVVIPFFDPVLRRTDISSVVFPEELLRKPRLRNITIAVQQPLRLIDFMDLVECGYDNISYDDTKKRAGAGGETETLYTNWYYEHDFSDAELRLLIDGVIFSRNIPRRQAGELIGRVERLGSSFFADRTGNITAAERDLPENKELFLTIEVLDEAIEKKRKVSFMYNDFGVDKKMHPRCSGGRPREYIVNPYRIVAANGNYYLVCNYDKYDNLANYRIDMLAYRFYRQPKVILTLFIERLKYVILINLMPASVIALGLPMLLYLTGGTSELLNYAVLFVSIITMSSYE